ncbi:MAG: hypothetical protein ABWZ43_11380, partial [Solirubrobacterales bacterium]
YDCEAWIPSQGRYREVTLPARGIELDQARLDQAVRAYADAGGSFSGTPGRGASSSGNSAGGPSG